MSGSRVWPAGWTRLHVYAIPDLDTLPELRELIARARAIVSEFPATIAPVPDRWIHATVDKVNGRAAADVNEQQRAALDEALRRRLAGLPPVEATAGPALTTAGGVLLDMNGDQPGEPWAEATTRVRAAIADVFGDSGLAKPAGPPHFSIGYTTAHQDTDPVQARLRWQVRPSRAAVRFTALDLVDVVQDTTRNEYRWKLIHRVFLGSEAN